MDIIKNEIIIKAILAEEKNGIIKTQKIIRIVIKHFEWKIWTYDKRFEY